MGEDASLFPGGVPRCGEQAGGAERGTRWAAKSARISRVARSKGRELARNTTRAVPGRCPPELTGAAIWTRAPSCRRATSLHGLVPLRQRPGSQGQCAEPPRVQENGIPASSVEADVRKPLVGGGVWQRKRAREVGSSRARRGKENAAASVRSRELAWTPCTARLLDPARLPGCPAADPRLAYKANCRLSAGRSPVGRPRRSSRTLWRTTCGRASTRSGEGGIRTLGRGTTPTHA